MNAPVQSENGMMESRDQSLIVQADQQGSENIRLHSNNNRALADNAAEPIAGYCRGGMGNRMHDQLFLACDVNSSSARNKADG